MRFPIQSLKRRLVSLVKTSRAFIHSSGARNFRSLFGVCRPSANQYRCKRLMVFGDSNAYRPGNGPNCWPAMLQRISGGTLRVANESCDGRTTRYDTGEYNGLGIIEEKIGKVQPIDIFLTALGINDLKRIYGPPNAEEIVAGIEQIRQAVYRLKPNVHFALATPAPMGNVIHGDLADAQHRLASVAEKYRRYASERKIPMIDLYLNLDPTTDLDLDGVHLNQRGRIKVANFVWDGIKKG